MNDDKITVTHEWHCAQRGMKTTITTETMGGPSERLEFIRQVLEVAKGKAVAEQPKEPITNDLLGHVSPVMPNGKVRFGSRWKMKGWTPDTYFVATNEVDNEFAFRREQASFGSATTMTIPTLEEVLGRMEPV